MDTLTRVAIFHYYFEAFPSEDQLLKYFTLQEEDSFFHELTPSSEGCVAQGSKEEITKFVSHCKIVGKKTCSFTYTL